MEHFTINNYLLISVTTSSTNNTFAALLMITPLSVTSTLDPLISTYSTTQATTPPTPSAAPAWQRRMWPEL